jgi:Family of unknown function (DUF6055)
MSYGIRRFAAGAVSFLALTLATTGSAQAARPSLPLDLSTSHFKVHYTTDAGDDQSSAAAAAMVANNMEAAYATEVGTWGFNAPVNDGDGKTDVYIKDTGTHLGESIRDTPGVPTTSGYVVIDPSSTGDAETAAHELFHILQYAIYADGAKFLKEGTAEWAGANVAHTTSWAFVYWTYPYQPLDCIPGSPCANSDLPYARWIFFDYLSEHYGPGIIKEIIVRAGVLNAGTDPGLDLQATGDVLAAHGGSLTQVFNDFTAANAAAAYAFPGLAGNGQLLRPSVRTYTGANALILPDHAFTVDHLAANFMNLLSGDSRLSNAGCGAATLHLSVDLPAGSASVPAIADSAGVHALSVSGGRASIDLPWTTCTGSSAMLGLPNPGLTGTSDGQSLVVHASLSASAPKLRRTTPPRIKLKLPKLASIARGKPFLHFRVKASGGGLLQVLLKSKYVRGSYTLHKGMNNLKLRLPHGFHGGRHLLVVTAYSTTGTRGKTVRRHVKIGLRGSKLAKAGAASAPARFAR